MSKLSKYVLLAILSTAFALLVSACGAPKEQTPPALVPITLQLKFTHQGQFAGVYTAAQKGFYADEGLDVTILEGGVSIDPIQVVLDEQADVGIGGPESILIRRSEGNKIQAFGVIFRINPFVFISLKEKMIDSPDDFVGQKIRVSTSGAPILDALIAKFNLPDEQIERVTNLESSVEEFISGEVPIWTVYRTGLALSLQQAGYDINIVFPDDYGVHFYADTLFAKEEWLAQNPEIARKFLAATLQGWKYAIENVEEAGEFTALYRQTTDVDLEIAKIAASAPLINSGHDPIGWMEEENWREMYETLLVQGIIQTEFDINDVFTMEFLEQVYP